MLVDVSCCYLFACLGIACLGITYSYDIYIYIYNYPDGFVDVAKWGDGPSEMVYFLSVLQVSHILLYPLVN